jgi:hypothetical protein
VDGEQFRQVVSTGPVTRLELRWDMFSNPDRLQIYDYSTGARGLLLLDTGYVGIAYDGCNGNAPNTNPQVFVRPQPSPANVCASQGGCFGLNSCASIGPCVTSGFSVSQIEVVVTSACAGSEWQISQDCA